MDPQHIWALLMTQGGVWLGQYTCMHIISSMSYMQYVCVMPYVLYRENGGEFIPNHMMRRCLHVGVVTGYITPDQSAALEKYVAAWEGRGRGGVTRPIDWEPVIASPVIQQTKFERSTDSCFPSIGACASGWHAHGLTVWVGCLCICH